MLDFIRQLTPEQKSLLIKINKDKRNWYKAENEASKLRTGGELFKTSFHDYAHSAPKTLGDIVQTPTAPLGIDRDSEAVARYVEDSVLQGLPWALPKRQITPQIQTMQQARSLPDVDKAYNSLYKLGQYSVEKKNNLQPGNYPAAKVMLNKFNLYNSLVTFGNPINKALKNQWVDKFGAELMAQVSDRLPSSKFRGQYRYLIDEHNLSKRIEDDYALADRLSQHVLNSPRRQVRQTIHSINPDFTDIRMDDGSGQYVGFPRVNGYMEMPVPKQYVDTNPSGQVVRHINNIRYRHSGSYNE